MHPSLRLGLLLPPLALPVDRALLAAMLGAAGEAGFATLWLSDGPATSADACTLAASLGGAAPEVRLGVVARLPSAGPARLPAVLARDVTALDVVTGGRASLGIAGDDPDEVAEAVAVCAALFAGGPVTHEGRFPLHAAPNRPGPLTPGGPPLVAFGDAGAPGPVPVATAQPGRAAAVPGRRVLWIADPDGGAEPGAPVDGVLVAPAPAAVPTADGARLARWAAWGTARLSRDAA